MPFTCHSHSGQFCSHARNSLEDMVRQAIRLNMSTLVLTEHMPRDHADDLYPEELAVNHTPATLAQIFDNYYHEAHRLRVKHHADIDIFVGCETEWIRPSSLDLVRQMHDKYSLDKYMGSVHHVHAIPIDFDQPLYQKAREAAGGTDEALYCAYFDAQYDMLKSLQPDIVGHFDLIRLKSPHPNLSWKALEKVWAKIVRNLELVASYRGFLEINTSALRKGLLEPYPNADICSAFLELGGNFALSDDSHSVDQLGWGYDKIPDYMERLGIDAVWYPAREPLGTMAEMVPMTLQEMRDHPFFSIPAKE